MVSLGYQKQNQEEPTVQCNVFQLGKKLGHKCARVRTHMHNKRASTYIAIAMAGWKG